MAGHARLPHLTLRWGILGTGAIARRFAAELNESRRGRLVSVASRSRESAEAFADSHPVVRAHASYEALLHDDTVDVVYVSTPHPHHARWAVLAAEAGKHVLCEKPLTLHAADAEAVVEAARANGVFLMEAFMYRCHPQTARLVSLVRDGAIGEVRVIEAVHSFRGSSDPSGRLLANELGGGAILDVGCYCMSGARLVAGEEPDVVTGTAFVGPTQVDEWAVAALRFPSGAVAHLATGVRVDQPPSLRVHGSEGALALDAPWLPGVDGTRVTTIVLDRRGRDREVLSIPFDQGLYAMEADEVAACIERGDAESSAMSWEDTLANMRALDSWRRAVGVVYEAERPRSLTGTIRGRALRAPEERAVPRGTIDGVRLPVSKAVIGTMLAEGDHTWPMAMAVFDAFFERGGNAFDTARRYGEGESDRALGHWLESRGVRDEAVVIVKGAHTPHCDPETLTRELMESLEDLRTDRADLYFLHRDNPDVPAAEFVDVLDEHRRGGRIDAFGGSNWTAARIDEANAYAAVKGVVGFTALSNHFSLARMVQPTFPGCISAADPGFRVWLARTRLPVLAWSSQAAGFFARAVMPGLEHAWAGGGNEERLRRADTLARDLGVATTTVALAWVLRQTLPIFPIIGPRSLGELRTSLAAFDVELSPGQLAWLDLEG